MSQEEKKQLASNLSSYKSLVFKGKMPKKEEKEGFRSSKSKPYEVKRYRKRSRSTSPSTGRKSKPENKKEKINYDEPDKRFGDFFCKACECHMNSEDMWYHHIAGKRHAKNTKGMPKSEVFGKKFDDIDGEPIAKPLIDAEKAPLVGLNDVRETQKDDKATYYCFLCAASIATPPLLIEHLRSMKHRMSYLKEYDKERFNIINESKLNKEQLDAIVLECVSKIEEEKGRGKMKIQRKKPDPYPARKHENILPIPRTQQNYDKSKFVWNRNASPERMHSPPPGRRTPPMNSKYDRHFDRNEDERYKNSYFEEDERYSRRSPEHMMPRNNSYEKYDSGKDYDRGGRPSNSSNSQLPQPGASFNNNEGDLRQLLEHKRSIENNVTDEALSIISALPTVSFFQLVLFKLDSIDIENDIELKLLERIVNKSTSMAVKVKSQFTPNLVEKFQESVKKTNLELSSASECSTQMEGLLRLVENLKDQRRLNLPSDSRQENIAYPIPSTSFQNEVQETSKYPVLQSLYSKEQPKNTSSYNSMHQTIDSNRANFSSVNSRPFYQSSEQSEASYSSGFSSFSSNPVSIPGLTLTQNPDPSEDFSPFKELEAKAKSIFGTDQWTSNNTPAYTLQRNPPY